MFSLEMVRPFRPVLGFHKECGNLDFIFSCKDWQMKIHIHGNQLKGNKSISTCKSLNKILSYIVGDCPCVAGDGICVCPVDADNRGILININVNLSKP